MADTAKPAGTAQIRQRLQTVVEHGFIKGWRRDGRRWIVSFGEGSVSRPYTSAEMAAWLDGARDMGVGGI